MNFQSFDEIIAFAAGKEKEAVAFYEELAGKAPQPSVKKLLQSFAREEQKHRDLLEAMGKNGEIPAEYKFKWVPDLKRSDYLVDVEYRPSMGFPDLLRLAMKREEASLKLYNRLMTEIGKGEPAKVFKMLCQEEAGHKNKLETMYDDYMAAQGD